MSNIVVFSLLGAGILVFIVLIVFLCRYLLQQRFLHILLCRNKLPSLCWENRKVLWM